MKLGDLTELAARNLREAVLRNSLTTLGISVGVASLVALLSLGVGLQQLVDRSVAHAGLFDTISVRSRQNNPLGEPGGGRRNPRDVGNVTPPRPLDDRLELLRGLVVVLVLNQPVPPLQQFSHLLGQGMTQLLNGNCA